jgi:hypothetical protein
VVRRRRLFVLAWVLGTVVLAGRLGASTGTETWVVPPLVGLGIPYLWAHRAHKVLRKGAHVLAYAGFALLVRWALEGVPHRARWALLAAFVLAVIDESLQAFSATRGGSVLDVLLDTTAAALALLWAERREARLRADAS